MALLWTVLPMVVLSLLVPAALYAVCNPVTVGERVAGWCRAVFKGRSPRESAARPFEEIAAEIRRLGRRFHSDQVSHVKAESLRRSYDEALVAGCAALDIEHLLTVLPPGPDLDAERARVETLLHKWGIDLSEFGDLDDAA